jgi:hypothetical protein
MRCAVASIPCITWTFVARGFSDTARPEPHDERRGT